MWRVLLCSGHRYMYSINLIVNLDGFQETFFRPFLNALGIQYMEMSQVTFPDNFQILHVCGRLHDCTCKSTAVQRICWWATCTIQQGSKDLFLQVLWLCQTTSVTLQINNIKHFIVHCILCSKLCFSVRVSDRMSFL